jgi:DNA-binding transcriptional LysR family regulator
MDRVRFPVGPARQTECRLQHGARLVAGTETLLTSHRAAMPLTMARAGQRAAWLPMTLADDDLKAGRLVLVGSETLDFAVFVARQVVRFA